MTLARLRVLLAGAELDLREMGVRDPDYAEIRRRWAEDDGPEWPGGRPPRDGQG